MPGLHARTAPTLRSAIGLDPWQWPTATAFCSWRGWAPRHAIAGGRACAGARCRPALAPATPCGWRRQRSVAATLAGGPPTGGCGRASVPKPPSSRPPTRARTSSTPSATHRTPCRDLRTEDSEQRARARDSRPPAPQRGEAWPDARGIIRVIVSTCEVSAQAQAKCPTTFTRSNEDPGCCGEQL